MAAPVKNLLSQLTAKNLAFPEDCCFLCGTKFSKKLNAPDYETPEHIFPKWLQKRFDLYDSHLILLNNTSIPYRQLTIPCCYNCNTVYLSSLEANVRIIFDKCYETITSNDERLLIIWCAKILYSVLYKEHRLPIDRKVLEAGSIIPSEWLNSYKILYCLLQSIRLPVRFSHSDGLVLPASVFVYELQTLSEPRVQWDFRDDVENLCVAVRAGKLGILVAFDAGALTLTHQSLFSKGKHLKLHPYQFEEFAAHVFYRSSLLDRNPGLIVSEDGLDSYKVLVMLGGLSAKPIHRLEDWDHVQFCSILADFWNAPFDNVLLEDGRIRTMLWNTESDNIPFYDLAIIPWKGIS